MRRLLIFVFYNAEGVADEYVLHLIRSFQPYVKRTVIAINGEITKESADAFREFSSDIVIRPNIGLDGGAYKDVICTYLKSSDLREIDELILSNDTFYGPLYPWDDVFRTMNDQDCDFWGLSSYYSDYSGPIRRKEGLWGTHIQGYFLVCRRRLFDKIEFMEFWRKMNYPKSLNEAVALYEVGFSRYFSDLGFRSTSYLEQMAPELRSFLDELFYLSRPFDLIQNFHFPIIKHKALSPLYIETYQRIIEYVRTETDYNVDLILEHQQFVERYSNMGIPFSWTEISDFYANHRHVWLYGHGVYAKKMTELFVYKGWTIKGYIVSENEGRQNGDMVFSDKILSEEDGVVLALNKENTLAVCRKIKSVLREDQIFRIWIR